MSPSSVGTPPASGESSTLVALDPLADGRERAFIDFESALKARPRHGGYAQVAKKIGVGGAA